MERRLKELASQNRPGSHLQSSPTADEQCPRIPGDDQPHATSATTHVIVSDTELGSLPPIPSGSTGRAILVNSFPYNQQLDLGPQPEPQVTMGPLLQEASPTFVDELKSVSLSVVAERHLGSTSGLSVAKLTQMVLRRLNPDKADFVFSNSCGVNQSDQIFDFDSSRDFFSSSMFETFSEAIPCHPNLFGDTLLAHGDTVLPKEAVSGLSLPRDDAYVTRLVDFYFAHSHTLYPILEKRSFLQTLQEVREDPSSTASQSPLALFRIWMVFAIGSTAYSSVTLTEESESRVYYSKALEYFEQAMTSGDIVRP